METHVVASSSAGDNLRIRSRVEASTHIIVSSTTGTSDKVRTMRATRKTGVADRDTNESRTGASATIMLAIKGHTTIGIEDGTTADIEAITTDVGIEASTNDVSSTSVVIKAGTTVVIEASTTNVGIEASTTTNVSTTSVGIEARTTDGIEARTTKLRRTSMGIEARTTNGIEARTTEVSGTSLGIKARTTDGIEARTTRAIVETGVGTEVRTMTARGAAVQGAGTKRRGLVHGERFCRKVMKSQSGKGKGE